VLQTLDAIAKHLRIDEGNKKFGSLFLEVTRQIRKNIFVADRRSKRCTAS
jgi:hypothetical protein